MPATKIVGPVNSGSASPSVMKKISTNKKRFLFARIVFFCLAVLSNRGGHGAHAGLSRRAPLKEKDRCPRMSKSRCRQTPARNLHRVRGDRDEA